MIAIHVILSVVPGNFFPVDFQRKDYKENQDDKQNSYNID